MSSELEEEDEKIPAAAAATAPGGKFAAACKAAFAAKKAEEAAEAAAEAAAAANVDNVVDLLDSDDDDDDDQKKPAAAATPSENSNTKRKSPDSAIINLTNAQDDDSLAAEYTASMVQQLTRNNKNKRQKRQSPRSKAKKKNAAAAATADAIEIDIHDGKKKTAKQKEEVDPAFFYRQALGPLRCDFVHALSGHSFAKEKQHPTLKTNKLYKELLEYKLNLPIELSSSIFVRVLESRLDLLRVLITGPEGTPYANGCFLFDMHVRDYPKQSPQVKFLTTGGGKVRFNPNLYQCGKVCLSLLGTWSGPGWEANKSTLLQVLVSIQGLILVSEPYFNEPGYEKGRNQKHHKQASERYTKNIRRYTLQHAMLDFLNQAVGSKKKDYPEFANVVERHFCQRADVILEQSEQWVKQDASLRSLVDSVRDKLDQLVEQSNYASAKPPPEVLTIDDVEQSNASAKPPPAAAAASPEVLTIDDVQQSNASAKPPPAAASPEVLTIDDVQESNASAKPPPAVAAAAPEVLTIDD